MDPPPPAVILRVRVPAVAEARRELTYRLAAENVSPASAHHVTVRVPVPPGTRFVRSRPEPSETAPALTWKLGTLAPRARKEIVLVLVPDGTVEVACCARVQFEHGECVRTRLIGAPRTAPVPAPAPTGPAAPPLPTPPASPPPAPPAAPPPAAPAVPTPAPAAVLQVRKEGPTQAGRYDILTFKVTVTNAGRATARAVVVEDTLPKGLDFLNSKPSTAGDNPLVWKLGDLPPGETRVVEYQAVAKEVGKLPGKAIVRAQGGLVREVAGTVQVGEPALAVRKAGPKQRLVGRPATYILTVSNPGTWKASHVELIDELPADIVFVGASDGGRLEGKEVRWSLGTLVPGERRAVLLTVQAKQRGTFKNVCKATASGDLVEQGAAETQFEDAGSLVTEIDRDKEVVKVGDQVTFTVRIFNGGKADEANLSAVATLPDGLAVIEVRGPTGSKTAGAKITFPVVAKLEPRSERIATIRAKAVKPGAQILRLSVVSDSIAPDSPLKGEETVTVVPAPASK
jgi:uncharacterized repeat protein (TIGR01451 family)